MTGYYSTRDDPARPTVSESGMPGPTLDRADFWAGNGEVSRGLPSFRAYSVANIYGLPQETARQGWHRCGRVGPGPHIFAADSRHGITRKKLTLLCYISFFVKSISLTGYSPVSLPLRVPHYFANNSLCNRPIQPRMATETGIGSIRTSRQRVLCVRSHQCSTRPSHAKPRIARRKVDGLTSKNSPQPF